MDYDAVADMYMAPLEESIEAPEMPATPARRLRDAIEPIATQGWWARAVHEPLAARGLGFFEAYVWGRTASLGEPAASVVVSAFGVFEHRFLSSVYDRARAQVSRDDVLAARIEGATASLASILGDADVAPLGDALLDAVRGLDGAARPFFSGLRELPVPDDPYGRLFRGTEMVREHRGDGHLAACVAADLDGLAMNVLTELWTGYPPGEYSSTRGFTPTAIAASVQGLEERGWVAGGRLTEAGLSARLAIEDATDLTQRELIARLGDGLDELTEALEALSARVIEAGAFPVDPRKRAAG
jgi:hypothetical protein